MQTPSPRIEVSRILKPRSVAVIGASEDESKFGGRIMHNVVRHKYAGRLLPINPNREQILGLPAYRDIASAPGPVDLALVAVPASQLKQTIDDCAQAGVGAVVVITAQLGEFDEAGARLQDEIIAIAAAHGMRIIGPNCMGLISAHHALGLTSSPMLQYADRLRAGPVAFVSQSGALMGALFVFGHDHGVGFTSLVSVGNQADLELADFLEALIEDDETQVICLYIEAIKNGARFVELARRARARGKRILAVKAGRTDAGSAMARSHTASLAGSYSAFEAVCRETGVLLVDEPEAMITAAGVLSKFPPMQAGGIGLVVSSGGGGAVTADRMTQAGLPIAEWSQETRARLDQHFLRTHQNNPIDLGAHIGALGPHVFRDSIDAVMDDPHVAAFMYIMTPQPLMPQTIEAVAAASQRCGKPTVFVLDTSFFGAELRQQLCDAGMPFVTRIDDALRVLDLLVRERAFVATQAAHRPAHCGPLPPDLSAQYLTEPEAKALAKAYGVRVTQEANVAGVDEAVEAAARIGYPVVAKGVSRAVTHKSDSGLVKLALADESAVRAAFAEIAATLARFDASSPTLSIQEMVRGEAELIIGARRDATFGAQVLVGFGGVMVELLHDVQVASAPVSHADAQAMLRRLRLWPLLDGARGKPRLDVAAVADILVRVSWLAADLGERLVDFEINPLIVKRAGDGAVAVDGRGTLAP